MMKAFFRALREASLSAWIGLVIVVGNALCAILAGWIAPYDPADPVGGLWEGFTAEHWLGTDQLGRDMLSRMLEGGQLTIGIALAVTALAFVIGVLGGFIAALGRGAVDQVLSRIVDALMAIPTLLFALLVLSVMGTSVPVLIVVIAILESTRVFRLARALALDLAAMDFVEVARLRGESMLWIMRREILPNTTLPLMSEFGLRFCFVVLFISTLSFLGLGIQPPAADWGGLVRENAQAINFGIAAPLIPAAAIAILTVGVNLVVDWMLARQGKAMLERPA
ncbi:peptide/nickel transport system permease protein [Arboricoccus pini]|uniref:Peptide/nickel transport system permease protein n=2 Tax=Arboricoccus pini TaxID=1963835 RepID=A0A212S2Z9_9PROT|nr:peptide/nickel transport system permease protein [Arboricoccus pini]